MTYWIRRFSIHSPWRVVYWVYDQYGRYLVALPGAYKTQAEAQAVADNANQNLSYQEESAQCEQESI